MFGVLLAAFFLACARFAACSLLPPPSSYLRFRTKSAVAFKAIANHYDNHTDQNKQTDQHPQKQLRKNDVVAAAKARGVAFAEGPYNRIMRELCRNVAGTWTTRSGKDDR